VGNVTTTVRRTKSGNGAMIIVHESDEARADRQRLRRERATAEAQRLQFTPGQLALLRRQQPRDSL